MKILKQNKIFNILWIVMAMHILNFSIDAPDIIDKSIAEDLSYNEIESLTELIAENILNIEDAFSESDEKGDEESGFFKKYSEITLHYVLLKDKPVSNSLINTKKSSTSSLYVTSFCSTIYLSVFSPPPKA